MTVPEQAKFPIPTVNGPIREQRVWQFKKSGNLKQTNKLHTEMLPFATGQNSTEKEMPVLMHVLSRLRRSRERKL